MRLLFLFALLLNLAFFAWVANRDPAPSSQPPSVSDGSNPLVLLHERQFVAPPQEAAGHVATVKVEHDSGSFAGKPARPSASPLGTPAATASCYTLGPFPSADEAAGIGEKLEAAGARVRQRVNERIETTGYWVYLPPYGSRERAVETMRELAQRGVTDYFIISAAEKQNAISLGLFRVRESAERRRNEIAKLGYTPMLNERVRTRFEYWLDYDLNGSISAVEGVYGEVSLTWPGLHPEKRNCE